jgi:Holliday junction DNA helicase RuvA
MADRIVLELKDKIGAGLAEMPATAAALENADVLAALTSLGYSVAEATRAASAISPSPDLSLEEKIKQALAYFGGK